MALQVTKDARTQLHNFTSNPKKGLFLQAFNAMIANKLAYYVYALADPRSGGALQDQIFYVGKGKGDRCFNHAALARSIGEAPLAEKEHKLGIIQDIRQSGHAVQVLVVRHGLSEEEALALEAVLIPLIGSTNKAAGHGSANLWLNTAQIAQLYDRPIQRRDVQAFHGNLLFVSLNRQDTDALLQDNVAMASATLGDWNLGAARSRLVDCIVGVKHGLVVSIYLTEKDQNTVTQFERLSAEKKGGHGRSRFVAQRALDLEDAFRHRSIHDGGTMLTKIRPGAGCQNFFAL